MKSPTSPLIKQIFPIIFITCSAALYGDYPQPKTFNPTVADPTIASSSNPVIQGGSTATVKTTATGSMTPAAAATTAATAAGTTTTTSTGTTSDQSTIYTVDPKTHSVAMAIDARNAAATNNDATVAIDFDSSVVADPQHDDHADASLPQDALITVNYPDEPIRSILRNVADLYDINLVVPDTLLGNTSIKLRDVNWRQIFQIVLKPAGFSYVQEGTVVRVVSLDEINKEPMELRTFNVKYAKASDIMLSLGPIITGDTPAGTIQVDDRSNSLIIKAKPSTLDQITKILANSSIDKVGLQVMIETKFMEVSNVNNPSGTDDGTGLGWWSNTAPFGGTTNFLNIAGALDLFDNVGGSSFKSVLMSANTYAMTLLALQTNVKSNLLGSPTLVTANNKKATFHVGQKQPLIEANFDTTTGTYTVGTVSYIDVGIKLEVTPRVNEGADQITLNVKPEVIKIVGQVPFTGSGGTVLQYPITSIRTAETNVNIKNGYTLAIGGLIQDDDGFQTKKVPFLGDLPYVGRIFRQEQLTSQKINLIMFITAKTLDPKGSSYNEVIDPRQIADMGVTDGDIPGYANGVEMPGMTKISDQHRQLLKELQDKRTYCYDQIARGETNASKKEVCKDKKKKNCNRFSHGYGSCQNFSSQKRGTQVARGF